MMRDDVIDACRIAIGIETGAQTLAIGRGLMAYVSAADLVGLPSDLDNDFRARLRDLRTREFEGETLAPSLFAHLRPTSRFRSRLTTSANLLIRAGLASLRVSINAVVQIVWIFGGGQLLDSLMVRAL
jgi:hypothetical protein